MLFLGKKVAQSLLSFFFQNDFSDELYCECMGLCPPGCCTLNYCLEPLVCTVQLIEWPMSCEIDALQVSHDFAWVFIVTFRYFYAFIYRTLLIHGRLQTCRSLFK